MRNCSEMPIGVLQSLNSQRGPAVLKSFFVMDLYAGAVVDSDLKTLRAYCWEFIFSPA